MASRTGWKGEFQVQQEALSQKGRMQLRRTPDVNISGYNKHTGEDTVQIHAHTHTCTPIPTYILPYTFISTLKINLIQEIAN